MNNPFTKYCLIGITAIILQACGESSIDDREHRTVFRYNESKGIQTLDPVFARNQTIIWPVHQLFNGLVQMDSKLNLQPCIASRWELSEDGRTYTFVLRDDVYFHDHFLFSEKQERKVKASDFVYSFGRITDPGIASPGAWIFHGLDKNESNNFLGFEALNDSIFKIYLNKPFPAFLGLLSMQYCSIVPEKIVEHYGPDFRSNPVGTGPFMLKYWKEGEKLVFVKNPDYFEKDLHGTHLPYLDAISISFVQDKQSEFLEFIKGNLDQLSGLTGSYKDELLSRSGQLRSKYYGEIILLTQPYLNTEYLGFLVDTSLIILPDHPLSNKKVRQAINYGFDRVKMIKYLRNSMGTPANSGFVPVGISSFSSEKVPGYYFDQEKARKLLIDAGYPNGEGIPPITLTTTSDYVDLCEYIQYALAEIGISINIEVNTGASFRNNVANSRLMFFRGSWIADYPDAENYLALFYSKNFTPAGPNYTHFNNALYDSLYIQSFYIQNDSMRHILYQEMDRMILDEAPIVPLFYDVVVRFIHSDIKGMEGNPMNLMTLKYVKKQ